MKQSIFFVAVTIVLFCSCNSSTDKKSTAAIADNDAPVNLQLQPADNLQVYYNITTQSKSQQTVRETKIKNDNKVEMGIAYTFKKDTGNTWKFTMQYDKFRLHLASDDIEKTLDASTAKTAFSPAEKIFSVLNDVTLAGNISQEGKVTGMTGVKEMTDRMYTIAGSDEEAKEMIESSVKQYVSDVFFKNIAEQCFNIYPPKLVKPGETWTVSNNIQFGFDIPIVLTYQLKSIKENIATISLQSDIDLNDQAMEVEGNRVTANLEGEQSGEMQIDISSGLLRSATSSFKIKGDVSVIGQTVPVSLSTHTTIAQRTAN